ncbi:MmgE/PrpD family protein [Gordonia sp. PP30]|uniref:MmgE/PrpD family protein n=1 Tax=unclassified Gordonia (in: high G+C Gram-positive bacteria) TaxID=2657482 RepID=UPI001FFE7527|nr:MULTISPECIES: MmgE/PrpD family protein [unclassified Gordonia (in: high G+C Gram-positive bacteria)]UQE75000.1 MmgE/PrpD family protein [Gordonia sp. PP30]
MTTLIDALAEFARETTAERLPADVVHESQRILLDTLGCDEYGADRRRGADRAGRHTPPGPGASMIA